MPCLTCLVSVICICIFICEEFIYGKFEDCIGLCIFHCFSFILECLLGKTLVTMAIQKCLGTSSSKLVYDEQVPRHFWGIVISLTLIFEELMFNFDVRCV